MHKVVFFEFQSPPNVALFGQEKNFRSRHAGFMSCTANKITGQENSF